MRCSSIARSKPAQSTSSAGVARDVFDEIARQAEGVVEPESFSPGYVACGGRSRSSAPAWCSILGRLFEASSFRARLKRFRIRVLQQRLQVFVQFREADLDGARELLFFFIEDARDASGVVFELGIGFLHLRADGRGHLRKKGTGSSEHVRVAQRAANDFAQHVAAAFVGGNHAVGNQERGGAGVVGDDAQRG